MWLPAALILLGVLCLGLLAVQGIETIFAHTLGMLDVAPKMHGTDGPSQEANLGRCLSATAYMLSGISSAERRMVDDYAGASDRHEVPTHARQRTDCR